MSTKTYKSVTVWGVRYNNVKIDFDADGVAVGGYIPGAGKVDADSAVTALINGESQIGTWED